MQNWITLKLDSSSLPQEKLIHLSSAQRAIVDWAKVDDHEAILDTDCGSGALLAHYLRHFHLRACGITNNFESTENHSLEMNGHDAEILRASKFDIPWRNDSFDAVFITTPLRRNQETTIFLREIYRVLKPQGRMLAAVPCILLLAKFGVNAASYFDSFLFNTPRFLMKLLEECNFSDVTMRCSRIKFATVIAQKGTNEVTNRMSMTETCQ